MRKDSFKMASPAFFIMKRFSMLHLHTHINTTLHTDTDTHTLRIPHTHTHTHTHTVVCSVLSCVQHAYILNSLSFPPPLTQTPQQTSDSYSCTAI